LDKAINFLIGLLSGAQTHRST